MMRENTSKNKKEFTLLGLRIRANKNQAKKSGK